MCSSPRSIRIPDILRSFRIEFDPIFLCIDQHYLLSKDLTHDSKLLIASFNQSTSLCDQLNMQWSGTSEMTLARSPLSKGIVRIIAATPPTHSPRHLNLSLTSQLAMISNHFEEHSYHFEEENEDKDKEKTPKVVEERKRAIWSAPKTKRRV